MKINETCELMKITGSHEHSPVSLSKLPITKLKVIVTLAISQ